MIKMRQEFLFSGDYILEVDNEYIPGSVKGFYLEPQDPFVPNHTYTERLLDLPVEEIGGKFVSISEELVPIDGAKLIIEYLMDTGFSRVNTGDRLMALEQQVEEQEKLIKTLLEAMKYRVDIQTFNTYLQALEIQLGISIFDNVFPTPYPAGAIKAVKSR